MNFESGIKAYARIKPTLNDPDEVVLENLNGLDVKSKDTNESFGFERVFGPDCETRQIFEEIMNKTWDSLTKGIKSTFLLT